MNDLLHRIQSGIAEPSPAPADDPRVLAAAIAAANVRALLRNGDHVSIPLYGKAPPNRRNNDRGGLSDWQNIQTVSDDLLLKWAVTWPDATNTGVLTAKMPTLDVDIHDEAGACAVEALVRRIYENRGKLLMRIGQPPKRAFPFRTEQPFGKMTINFKKGGKLEFLGDGQQVVVDGIHPDTGKPYAWFGGELVEVARAQLPPITEAEATALMEQAAELLVRDFGYVRGSDLISGGMSPDREVLVQNILEGTDLHDSLCSLAAKLAASGTAEDEAIDFLQELMNNSKAAKDTRWQDRFDDIPRLVKSGEDKFGRFAPVEDWSTTPTGEALRKLAANENKPSAFFGKASASASDTGSSGIVATPYEWIDPDKIPLREWLYGRLLIRQFVTATVAPGGVGKSTLVTAETLAQVSGKNLLGITPEASLRVWLWNLEDPKVETVRKIQAVAKHYGLIAEDLGLGDRLFVDSGRDQPLVTAVMDRNGVVIVRPTVDALVAEIIRRKIDIIVIDPFVSSHEVPENDNTSQDMVVKEWGRVADKGNCAVHLVDHTRKMGSAEAEVTTESSRGAKAKTDAARVVRVINRMSKDEGEKAGVVNHRLYFRTYNDKANMQPPLDHSDWFELKSVSLGNARYGGDEVGVATRWQWPNPLAGVDFKKVAAVIARGKWRENSQAKAWVGHAIAEGLDLDLDEKSAKAKVLGMIKLWIALGVLVVVKGVDEHGDERKFIEVRGADGNLSAPEKPQ